MAIPTFNAIGFCAHYSKQGDWAFDCALKLTQELGIQLNVFHFLSDPYDMSDNSAEYMSYAEMEKLAIEKEKELRLYYDNKAGEYLNVGFRVCYDKSWTELHKCLLIREFQLLVLGYPDFGTNFGSKPIEEFADSFISPVILVGPDRPDQYYVNTQAALQMDILKLKIGGWSKIELENA